MVVGIRKELIEEKVAKWKFLDMDRNRNGVSKSVFCHCLGNAVSGLTPFIVLSKYKNGLSLTDNYDKWWWNDD